MSLVRITAAAGESFLEHFAHTDLGDVEQSPTRHRSRLVGGVRVQLIDEQLARAVNGAEVVRLGNPQPAVVLEANESSLRNRDLSFAGSGAPSSISAFADIAVDLGVIVIARRRRHRRVARR